jgi:hypothetical protein
MITGDFEDTSYLVDLINEKRKYFGSKTKSCSKPKTIQIKQLKNKCIVVTSHNPSRKYLSLVFGKKDIELTRLLFYIKNEKLKHDRFVCHRCNNGRCVNINHLFLGSQKDNIDDCVKKKRHCFGERNGMSKLTRKQVREMRKLYAIGEWKETKKRYWGKPIHSNKYNFKRKYPASYLSREFGVCRSVAQNVVSGVTWKQVG